METDIVNVLKMPIGIIVLNINLLARTNRCEYSGNNFHNGGYKVITSKQKKKTTAQ